MEEKIVETNAENFCVMATNYTVSQHAAERYVERAWHYQAQTDKTRIANQRMSEIKEFLNKLCTYGEIIYDGALKKYKRQLVYKKDNWVIIVDPQRNTIITCYPLQFGAGEDFDIEYVNRMSKKLEEAVNNKKKIEDEVNSFKSNYEEKIKHNEEKINEYKKIINTIENENNGLKTIVQNCNADIRAAQLEIENIVESLTCKKIL